MAEITDDLTFIKQLYRQFEYVSLSLSCDCAEEPFYETNPHNMRNPLGLQPAIDFFTGLRHGPQSGHQPYVAYCGASNEVT